MTTPTPSDIARETLRTLAARKLAPTPDNYGRVYHEIGGTAHDPAEAAPTDGGQTKPALAWPKLIHDLLKQLDTPHKGITVTRKKDGLEMVLGKFSSNSDVLFEKLQGLMNSWAGAPTAANLGDLIPAAPEPTTATAPAPVAAEVAPGAKVYAEMVAQLRELLAQTLESSLTSQQ